MDKRAEISGQIDKKLKEAALEHFQTHAASYTDRYFVGVRGDVLWPRHNAILELLQRMGLPRDSRIVDLGCGPGLLSFDLAKLGYQGMGIDASPAMIERCKRYAQAEGVVGRWDYQLGDVEALPFKDGSFDVAVSAGVIEYLPSDENLLREAARVLKPGGLLILAVTNRYGYTVSLSAVFDYLKRIPTLMRLADAARRVFVGGAYGVTRLTVIPRKHRPKAAREMLSRYGFRVQLDKYVHFTLLPAPFCMLFSKLKPGRKERLGVLDRTFLRGIGSCYILCALK